MDFTDHEKKKISERSRQRIEKAIKAIVEWSFTVRPMRERTDSETKRREKICLDYWRRQVSKGWGADISAKNLPLLLIAAIDHEETGERAKSIVEPQFATGMFPSPRHQVRMVEPELAITATAANGAKN